MKFGPIPFAKAEGKILAHAVIGPDGRKVLSKGHILKPEDIEVLNALGLESVVVADLDPTDLSENEAARRVGKAIAGAGVRVLAPGVGRANLIAESTGPLCVNVPVLTRLNNIDEGITIATQHEHTLVEAGQLVTLVKIIPFGIPASRVEDVEAIALEAGAIISVRALQKCSVGLIVSGPESARQRLLSEFMTPVCERIEKLGSILDAVVFVPHTIGTVAHAIQTQYTEGRKLILIAGVSAITDREDITPLALRVAGGSVTQFGVPVDPGSLLMLGYLNAVPVVGAPGCVKSPKTNVIDWILPRLLAGERLTRADLVAMGHGGLLDDISDRPMPRE